MIRVDSGDLVASVGADTRLADLDAALPEHNAWIPLDAPGPRNRTLGDALAAGAAGPLAAGYGAPRDQVLGLTFVTGNGATVKTGGRVVKNVAGFDLAKLLIGSHGAFGTITEAHLRLRVRPVTDRTIEWHLPMDESARATTRLLAGGVTPVAMEVAGGLLRVRCLGSEVAVEEELEACVRLCAHAPVRSPSDVWDTWRETVGAWPVCLRIGADPSAWREAVRLVPDAIGYSVTVPRGTVRVGLPSISKERMTELRSHGLPVTLEQADDATLRACGRWGALEPGVEALTKRLKKVFDPEGAFDVPVLT